MKALVTGAGQGIGRAIAHRLAADGARVVAVDLDAEAAAATAREVGGVAAACDIGDEAAVAALAETVDAVDTVINNAGIWRSKALGESTFDEVERVLRTNVIGTWLITRALVPKFPATGGAIVNLTSVLAATGGAGRGAYPASKAAIVGLTRQMAAEYAPLGIRVNAVGPGLVLTEGTRGEFGDPGVARAIGAAMPLGRLGTPDDIAAAVGFLASPAAGYVTGQVLFVDGGWSINGSAFIAAAVRRHVEQAVSAS
ncbi:SDR family oxidoreductase [Nocardia sp. CDC159]|uniref:SDR family oxidoreductase n=1 Tax=Nocardia pulmonis TaxID=2951408 RepID=A0A9X2E3T7_9NOCA|nr:MULTISPECIES: SDR family oxidoreductase [Nocardia]MCM6772563.1 SDR family oxidoreductase [Nocardia pulmonis]MCM6784779.1 SDR family oxidoreductase [Nocardia sp. CDC159]